MTIPADAKTTPLPRANGLAAFVDLTTGALTPHGLQLLDAWRNYIVGMNRVIPCSATGTNVITLTPNDSSPLLEKYVDHEIFVFAAADTSTGAVTMTVVPRDGVLATYKVYITGGASQAGAGDVVSGRLYLAIYHSTISVDPGFILNA